MSTDPERPTPPGRASASACEPYREIIAEALTRGRNAVAIWQDLSPITAFRRAMPASVASWWRLRGAAAAEVKLTNW